MTSNQRPLDDRPTPDGDTLCALFDGELQGDAARFALKRLGHDAQWRQACGRWQLYGDVMRGQATGVAAGGFAERVALAIAAEAPLATAAPVEPRRVQSAPARHGSRRGWIGGALAASVAMAALFVTRPFSDTPAPSEAQTAPAQVAASVATPAVTPAPTPEPTPKTPDQGVGLSAAAVAVAEAPRRAVERRSTRSQSQRAALRASRQELPIAAAASAPATAVALQAVTPHATTGASANPFQPQHEETATSRPWPRAVLPQYSSSGALTASYGSSAGASFYPFEPGLAEEAHAPKPEAGDESDAPQQP